MTTFNNGKPYQGSDNVTQGKLHGSTAETDYFYFFCPKCPDKHVLRILDYGVHAEGTDFPYKDQVTKKAKRSFTLAFHLYCERCKFTDFVKISNTGWQHGTYAAIMANRSA
ncbi:hypothetical protein MTYM_00871 [Methylococcales bacterium]|nr:hypothetical protein MTYM_00871 [Methylococcales bacterium]